jgi:hypothetical protein
MLKLIQQSFNSIRNSERRKFRREEREVAIMAVLANRDWSQSQQQQNSRVFLIVLVLFLGIV